MKFMINGALLAQSLNSISGLVGESNTVPFTETFLFELEDKTLNISSTNLESFANLKVDLHEADNYGITRICVPGKEILGLANSLKLVTLTIFVNDNFSIDISTTDGGKYTFMGVDPEDFPQMMKVDDPATFTIPSSVLVKGLNSTLVATASDDIRPQMNGVLCEFSDKGLTFVGTDSRKLVLMRNTKFATSDDSKSFIFPKKPLIIISKILSSINQDLDIKVESNESNIAFYFDNYHFAFRLIEGKYPQYEVAIPKEDGKVLVISKGALLDTVERIATFMGYNIQLRLEVSNNKLIAIAEDADNNYRASETLMCSYDAEPITIGLNPKYMKEMLLNVDTDNVRFDLYSPSMPCVLVPFDTTKQDESEKLIMLLMPLVLQNNDN